MLVTTGMAKELASARIRVLGINPGAVETERFRNMVDHITETDPTTPNFEKEMVDAMPTGRLVQPEDVADLVAFAVSDRARQLNGTTVTLDGGSMRTAEAGCTR